MKKSRLLGAVFACAVTLVTTTTNAAVLPLESRLSGLAYYDLTRNITWLANANVAGGMDWGSANSWAENLDLDGIAGPDGWRLPSSLNLDGTGPCGPGFGCTDSEMGHLFYNVLGGATGSSITTTHNSNYDLFSNVQSYNYWSSTPLPNSSSAWDFIFAYGGQTTDAQYLEYYAWAVIDGDPFAVPTPPALWLFGSGLLGLVGISRRKKTV